MYVLIFDLERLKEIRLGKGEHWVWEVVALQWPDTRLQLSPYLCFLGSATAAGKESVDTVPVPIWRAKVAFKN